MVSDARSTEYVVIIKYMFTCRLKKAALFHCFIIVFSWFKCFYDDALTEFIVNHYANPRITLGGGGGGG